MRSLALLLALAPAIASAQQPGLTIGGYLDLGFADAQGDGTSFLPGDTRIPADYGVDPFQPMVNSRGEAASIRAPVFENGFLPRTAGIGGTPSFLLNTVSVDALYLSPDAPVLLFARGQLLPRLAGDGADTRALLAQGFVRVAPISTQELFVFFGKFDPVFGVEYLEREAPLRTGVTPSLMSRYTVGEVLGGKLTGKWRIPAAALAFTVNASGTTSAPFVESLQSPDGSRAGGVVGAARVGVELELGRALVRVGGSGLYGPRNDQTDAGVNQRMWGADLRVLAYGAQLSGEWVDVRQDAGTGAGKITGQGDFYYASGFWARGGWAQAAYAITVSREEWLRALTPFVRAEQRTARFDGFPELQLRRLTAGARVDLFGNLALKGEVLLNGESEGAPVVDNDVIAASAVVTF